MDSILELFNFRKRTILYYILALISTLLLIRILSPFYFYGLVNLFSAHRTIWFPTILTLLSLSLIFWAYVMLEDIDDDLIRFTTDKKDDENKNRKIEKQLRVLKRLGGLGILVGIALLMVAPSLNGYYSKVAYLDNLAVTSGSEVELPARIPYQVALKRASNSLASSSVSSYDVTNTDKGMTALTVARGGLFGSQPYANVVESDGVNCNFVTQYARARIGGTFNGNLQKKIVRKFGNLQMNSLNTWAYCKNGAPMVIIPVTKYHHPSIFITISKPAGVVSYNGKTGKLTYVKNVGPGQFPGPSYPLSIASLQREAMMVLNQNNNKPQGYFNFITNKFGWVSTESIIDDPNQGNPTELTFNLNEGSYYSTPLVVKGSSTAYSGRADLNGSAVNFGEFNPITLVKFTQPLQSGSVTVSEIKRAFPSIGWETKMEVYEIYPASTTTLRGSIGSQNAVSLQLLITLKDKNYIYCLFSVDQSEKICASADKPIRSTDPFESSKGSVSVANPLRALTALSREELLTLLTQLTNELKRRG